MSFRLFKRRRNRNSFSNLNRNSNGIKWERRYFEAFYETH